MNILDFITKNLIWIIIVFIVILLALIGYIAEKEGLLKNKKKQPKEKLKTIKDYKEDNKLTENINLIENKDNFEKSLENKEDEKEDIEKEESIDNNEVLLNDLSDDTEQINEDLYAPFGDQTFEPSKNTNIDRDFNDLMDEVDEVAEKADIEVPDIKEITEKELDDEDIWKF